MIPEIILAFIVGLLIAFPIGKAVGHREFQMGRTIWLRRLLHFKSVGWDEKKEQGQ